MSLFGWKMACHHLWIHSKDFFEILHNERDQEVHENYINGFSGKKVILGKWAILGLKMV